MLGHGDGVYCGPGASVSELQGINNLWQDGVIVRHDLPREAVHGGC